MPDEMDAVAIVDVTAEVVGERREEFREGVNAGIREGTARVVQSHALTQLALELRVLRVAMDAASQVAQQREALLNHWKGEAQWWREEHDRVSSEYSAFVKETARRLGK